MNKSHIMIPRLIMKKFSNKISGKGTFVKRLDITTMNIEDKKISELDVEYGYYVPVIETYLANSVERPFGDVAYKIYNMNKTDEHPNLTTQELQIMRNFIKMSIIRNPKIVNEIKNEDPLINLIDGFDQNYIISVNDAVNNQFLNKKMYMLLNKSRKGFVVPHNMMYALYFKSIEKYVICMTINSHIILCLDQSSESNEITVGEIMEDSVVVDINKAIFAHERKNDNPYIIGYEKDLLELKEKSEEINENYILSINI